jgi:hypothetical protein
MKVFPSSGKYIVNLHPRNVGSIWTFPEVVVDALGSIISGFDVGAVMVNPPPYSSSNPAFEGNSGNAIIIVSITNVLVRRLPTFGWHGSWSIKNGFVFSIGVGL